jgi:hypothetical protein
MTRRDIGDGRGGRTWTVIVVVIELRGYDHRGVLELDIGRVLWIVCSGHEGRVGL